MKELLDFVARHLVDNPDEVSVTETDRDGTLVLELRVAPEDMGKVIGRQGRIVREIRILLKAAGQRNGQKIMVEIMD